MVRWWSVRLWGAHLLALVCVGIAAAMGLWQFNAYQDRRDAERVDLTHAEPVPVTDVLGADDPFPTAGLGRPVEVRGTFVDSATVLVTGREGIGDHAGQDGRWIVTPLTVGDPDDPAIPVVRGWVPASSEIGSAIADVPPAPTGEVEVTGWLQPTESSTGSADQGPEQGAGQQDRVLAHVRAADLVQLLPTDQDLYGAFVIAQQPLEQDAAAGLVAGTLDQLPPASRFTGLRNLLYAIEWWVFAAFAAFLWFRYVRDATTPFEVEGPEVDESGDEAGQDDAVPSTT